tara:strand:- start:1494 stop:2750 length:1257 start_codon:yes stop_codon:yes gene_type:complete
MSSKLTLDSNSAFYNYVCYYTYEKNKTKVKDFKYLSQSTVKPYEYIPRSERGNTEYSIKMCSPNDLIFDFVFEDKKITFGHKTKVDENNNPVKILVTGTGCGCNNSSEELILKEITLQGEDNDILIKYVDTAKTYCEEKINLSKKSTNSTIKVNMWRKDYWNLLFKSQKRPLDTLYLKEGQKDELIKNIEEFYDPDTRADYLSHGIPYKNVIMLYGPPGTGKTSTINTIASHFDADVYVIPISKELTDYGLIDAISYLEEKEEKKRIIIIEDIDAIFTDRKKGDDDNGVTLQGLLNCFDGFACVEGTLLFITANKPEVIDNALLRSCRVDHKYELGYADEYQTKFIFEKMAPENDKQSFRKFYNLVKSKEYTTAMLQEFLFPNRKKDTIFNIMDDFNRIINNNKEDFYGNKDKDNLYL